MSENYIIKYPLDLTGTSPENNVLGELHTLEPGINRAAIPRYGAFFTESLVVLDTDTGEALIPNDQYVPIMYYADPSERTGKEVCAGIIVTDQTVSSELSINYQVVGGDYANITQVILDLIANLNLDSREVMWGDLLGRPDAFPPDKHLHDLGDLYGFEYVVQALDEVRQAILYGDQASHQELRDMIDARYQSALVRAEEVRAEAQVHADRQDNPHVVTKAQVGLGLLSNYQDASQVEAEDGTSNSRFMTPNRVRQAIESQAGIPLNDHMVRIDNPHSVTKAQVGLGNVDDYLTATSQQAVTGERADLFVTPAAVKAAIAAQAGSVLQSHISDYTNPHQVTKTQVGLPLVRNHAMATVLEAEEAVRGDLYMSPATTKALVDVVAGAQLEQHVSATNNPHNVTKAQVSLGAVQNYGMASSQEAIAGEIDNRYMSPLRVREAIDSVAGEALQLHLSDYTNPHRVTKAQVELGNLPNAVTSSRTLDDEAVLLSAKAMRDHVTLGDHDASYVKRSGDFGLGVMEIVGQLSASTLGSKYGDGTRSYAMFVDGDTTDSGGIVVHAADNNGDENAFSAVNYLNNEVFRVKATTGRVESAHGFTQYSDSRRKTDVETLNNALTTVQALRGVRYRRTDRDEDQEELGFIAQEVMKIVPQAVSKDDSGYYQLNYIMLIPLLLQAIVELSGTVEGLPNNQ
jgi:hypothetical protein